MNVLTGVGILLLSMLIVAFLQLCPSILMIFLHYCHAKYSKLRTSDLTLFYIFGVEVFVALVFVLLYYIATIGLSFLPNDASSTVFYILSAILLIIGICFPFLYFRRGDGTRLFISRKIADNFTSSIKKTKRRSDAFMLGFSAGMPELILTVPLYLLCTMVIVDLGEAPITRAAMILLFVIVTILPLFVIRFLFSRHFNLANIQMFRERNKKFFGFLIGILYILVAITVFLRVNG